MCPYKPVMASFEKKLRIYTGFRVRTTCYVFSEILHPMVIRKDWKEKKTLNDLK